MIDIVVRGGGVVLYSIAVERPRPFRFYTAQETCRNNRREVTSEIHYKYNVRTRRHSVLTIVIIINNNNRFYINTVRFRSRISARYDETFVSLGPTQ